MQEPWFREARWAWYVEIDGRQRPLGKHPSDVAPKKGKRGWSPPPEILAVWHALIRELAQKVERGVPADNIPRQDIFFAEVGHRFLEDVRGHIQEETRLWYLGYLQDFRSRHPKIRVSEINREVVLAWLDAERDPIWGVSSIRGAICSLKRCLNWAVEEGVIRENPIGKIRKPKAKSRIRVVTPAEQADILSRFPEGDPFRDFLVAIQETGCRPGEIMKVRAGNVNLTAGTWEMKGKDFNVSGELRTVYLTPTMVEMSRRLMMDHPTGALFRNSKGEPWNRRSINNRFVRKKAIKDRPIAKGITAYAYRHTFVTDALAGGVERAAVQKLVGHRTSAMLDNYIHLDAKPEFMREAAIRAVRGETAPATPPPEFSEPTENDAA